MPERRTWARAPAPCFAQIAAQELGAPQDWVTVVMGDTAIVPYDAQTSASRSTVLDGQCRSASLPLHPGPAPQDGGPAARRRRREDTVDSGVVRLPDRELTVLEVLKAGLGGLGGELTGNGESRKEAEPDHPLQGAPAFFEFNCTAIEARVDEGTGDALTGVWIGQHQIADDPRQACTGVDELPEGSHSAPK